MRKDININVETSDIILIPKDVLIKHNFQWIRSLEGLDDIGKVLAIDNELAEITIDEVTTREAILANGIVAKFEYDYYDKPFYIKIRYKYFDNKYTYLQNLYDSSIWFKVYVKESNIIAEAKASRLASISTSSLYFSFNNKNVEVYSGSIMDVEIKDAIQQSANLLLKCKPTNNYRYPTSGIGASRWHETNINQTKLASILQDEFLKDGVIVNNASYNYQQQKLNLDISLI